MKRLAHHGEQQSVDLRLGFRPARLAMTLLVAACLLQHEAQAVLPACQVGGGVHLSGEYFFDGLLEVEAFTLGAGARVLFSEDLTLRCPGPIVIDGEILGLSRNDLVSRSGEMRGADLVIESATSITVRGSIRGSQGRHGNLSPFALSVLGVDADFTDARPGQLTELLAQMLGERLDLRGLDGGVLFAGGAGGNILLRAPVVWVGGPITGGDGGDGGPGGHGGHAGSVITDGPSLALPGTNEACRGGRAGEGGAGVAGLNRGRGGDGGNGGAAVAWRHIPEETARQILKASAGGTGQPGNDQVGSAGAAGGSGSHGTCNWPAASSPGGAGGNGGNGQPGEATDGMTGGSGRSQCNPPGTGKAGGNGGNGGKGTGGAGGPGGAGGNGIDFVEGVCTASCGGAGGPGGDGKDGKGGKGGNPGSGGAGCPGGPPGQGGRGGAAVAGGHGAGGAVGIHGVGIACGSIEPGPSGASGSATPGTSGGIGAYGVQCQNCR